MKNPKDYGSEFRKLIKNLANAHPKTVRIYAGSYGLYERLQTDGIATIAGNTATITKRGLRALEREQKQ